MALTWKSGDSIGFPFQPVLGLFQGVPTTKKSIFHLPAGPITSCFVKRILKRSAPGEAEVGKQIRLTVIHELGQYIGMDENQLKDV
jgi:predicted Zn-dependent protease with MMP-like domain